MKLLEDENIEIEISNINNYKTFKTFNLIGVNQVESDNIKEINCSCVRDTQKKMSFVIRKEEGIKVLNTFGRLMMDMQDDVFEADFEHEVYSPENYSYKAMESSDVMETLFLLEESGCLKYDVEKEEVSININGMEPISGPYIDIMDNLKEIKDNPELSNIFARVGPPQDLSDKIHTDADARKAAKTFSEERKSLEDLLYSCFTNNIKTHASCAGHEEYVGWFKDGYISFNLNDEFTKKFIKYLNEKIETHENDITIDEIDDSTIIEKIGCDYETADNVFTEIRSIMEEYIATKETISELNGDNQLNKRIDDMLSNENKGINNKLGFLDVLEGGIKLSSVQEATHYVRESKTREITPNNEWRDIN